MSNKSATREMVTLADALERLQVRFAALHQFAIRTRLDPELYARGRRLMVWLGDRCDIPAFEAVPLTPAFRFMLDEFPMNDYRTAVESGEALLRAYDEAAGFGRRNHDVYAMGKYDAEHGNDYNAMYVPEIDNRTQQVRYPTDGFDYYQGFRAGRDQLFKNAERMRQDRHVTITRRNTA